MIKQLLTLCLLFVYTVVFSAEWRWLEPKPQAVSLSSVCFVNQEVGYLAGNHGTISKTTDAGKTWTSYYTGFDNDLFAAWFTSVDIGYAVGSIGIVIKTTDGGITWSKLAAPDNWSYLSICVVDQNTIFIGGSGGVIIKSTDAGETWQKLTSNVETPLNSINFANQNVGYAVGYEGKVIKTENGGDTWQTLSSISTQDLWDGFVVDANTVYVVGGNGAIMKTTDGGNTWVSQTSGISGAVVDVYFTSKDVGFVTTYENYMLKTTNGGTTWSKVTIPTLDGIEEMLFTSPQVGYAVGDLSTVIKTTDGGNTWFDITEGTNEWLNASYFISKDTLVVVGSSGTIIRSTDGGMNWKTCESQTTQDLYSVTFVNSLVGYACGRGGTIIKTTDAGATWDYLSIDSYNTFSSILFTDSQRGFVVGSTKLYVTEDGGATWTKGPISSAFNLVTIFFASKDIGYIAGAFGTVYKTTDGGTSWSEKSSAGMNTINSLFFLNPETGYAVSRDGDIFYTLNGGENWNSQTSNTKAIFNSVYFTDAMHGYIVGCENYILYTENGGQNWKKTREFTYFCLDNINFTPDGTGFVFGELGTILTNAPEQTASSGLKKPAKPSGTSSLCPNTSTSDYTTSSVDGATKYVWTIWPASAGNISGTSKSATVTWNENAGDAAWIKVAAQNDTATSPLSDSLKITFVKKPASPKILVSGTTTFCEGGQVTLTCPMAKSYLWSNNQKSNAITVGSQGSYSVSVVDASGCYTLTSDTIKVTVNLLPSKPTISISPKAICPGEKAMVSVENGFISYQWSTGQNTASFQTETGGAYQVTVTDINGCSNSSWFEELAKSEMEKPVLTLKKDTIVCNGKSLDVFVTNNNGGILTWDDQSFATMRTLSKSTTISVTVTDGYGCKATSDPLNVTFSNIDKPDVNATTTVISVDAGSNSVSWYEQGSQQLVSDKASFVPGKAGKYFATLTNADGCSSSSDAVVFLKTGINITAEQSITVSQSAGIIHVVSVDDILLDVAIYNSIGQLVETAKPSVSQYNSKSLKLGVYSIIIKTQEGTFSKFISIQ